MFYKTFYTTFNRYPYGGKKKTILFVYPQKILFSRESYNSFQNVWPTFLLYVAPISEFSEFSEFLFYHPIFCQAKYRFYLQPVLPYFPLNDTLTFVSYETRRTV